MTSRPLQLLSRFGIWGVVGLVAAGCAIQDPPALVELGKARKALDTHLNQGILLRCPGEYADLERRHLQARGVFYACNDDEAIRLAQAILNDAGALDACGAMPKAACRVSAQVVAPREGLVDQVVALDGSGSSDPDGRALTYVWDFGDGETARFTFPRTTHVYRREGNYTVKLTVEAAPDCTNTTSAPITVSRRLTLASEVLFDFNKSLIKPAGAQALAPVVQALRDQPTLRAELVGHTDSVGSDQYNQRLSLRRAEAVRNHLVSQGINPARITVDGMGESQPVVPNDTEANRAKNRRVEITLRPQAVQ
jgi:outer membrane protein OmpA-like peptidoglycan-associated protein